MLDSDGVCLRSQEGDSGRIIRVWMGRIDSEVALEASDWRVFFS